MVAAVVVPFSSVGPEHDVDRDTDLMMHEHMGGNDVVPLIGKSAKKPHAAEEEAATATPMDAETYASAVAESGGVLATGTAPAAGAKKTSSKSTAKSSRRAGAASRKAAASDDDSSGWPTPLVVVPAVFDEWDAPEGARHASDAIPDWATPGARDGYSMASNFYQRRFEEDADFVPNRGYETSVYIKFIIDHYRNLPDVTAFVKGSFAPEDAKARLKAVAKKAKKIGFQPLTVDVDGANERLRSPDGFDPELGFVRSRSPGELVQMWKNRKWGWEDIMGDTAGAAAAHLSRCWRGLGAEFASAASDEQADVGQYMFHASHPKKHEMGGELVEVTPGIPQREQALASAEPAPEVSEADKRELSLPAPSISAYPGGSFAVSKERLRRVPLETWKALYQRFAVDGTCLPIDEESAEAPRDDIRDKFDLGVSLEHLSHVIFGGERLDAGEDARCCGAECALEDAACAKSSSSSKSSKKSSKAASHQPTREEAAEAHMRVVEEKIGRYNGWNLRELRVERAAETASPDERETAALSELGAAREVEPTDKKEAAEAAEAASTKESSASSTKESSASSTKESSSTKSSSKKASSKKASAAGKRESSDASEKKVKQEFYIPKDWEKERDGEHPPQTNPAWKRFVDEEQKHIDDAEKEEAEAEALHPSDEDSEQPTAAELEAERKAASKESEKTAMFEDRIAQLEEENEALKFQQKQAIAAREEEKVKLMRLAKEEIDALDAKEEALKTTVNAMKKENAKTADDLEEKLEYAEARERDAAAKRRDAVATAQKLRARLEHQRTRGHSEGAAGAAEEEENGELEEKLESAERALREKEIEVEQEKQKRIEIAEAARALRERLAAIRGDKTAHAQGAAKDAAAKAKKPAAADAAKKPAAADAAQKPTAADAAQKPAATEAAQKPTVHKPAAAEAAQKPAAQKPAAAAQKPVAAKVGAADASDVAALALPPRRRTNPAAQQSEIAPSKDAVETERRRR